MKTASERAKTLPFRLSLALFLPLLLLLAVGFLLFFQLSRMSRDAEWLEQADQTISNVFELEKRIVDHETAVRGYLMSRDPDFLEPLGGSNPKEIFAELERALAGDEAQRGRLHDARANFDAWLRATANIRSGRAGVEDISVIEMRSRKVHMDDVRRALGELLSEAQQARAERDSTARERTNTTFGALIALLTVTAGVLGVASRKQLRDIVRDYETVFAAEKAAREELEATAFVRSRQLELSTALQGELEHKELGEAALAVLVGASGANLGALYLTEGDTCVRVAARGFPGDAAPPERFSLGSGLVGQAARDKKPLVVCPVPEGYLRVESATGNSAPAELALLTAVVDRHAFGVIELAFLEPISAQSRVFLQEVSETLAIALRDAAHRERLRELLAETRAQASELQQQHEEVTAANEELETQRRSLEDASRRLELQQVELEQTNQNLAEQGTLLREQNDALLRAQEQLAERAAQIAQASRYKSEFLANMSHELRTPLNSSLILAKLLAENKDGNLSSEQIKFAETIYAAGNDLLALINDVLDLSQIEAGRMPIHLTTVTLDAFLRPVSEGFDPIARERGLRFEVATGGAAFEMTTDVKRLQQVLKNLLSNAFKFTEQGSVTLRVRSTGDAGADVEFQVKDTGIGIAKDQQAAVFEAFRQADGTTNRRYGGTGLGLAISRDLARRLGGEIKLDSVPGRGSTFTVTVPRVLAGSEEPERAVDTSAPPRSAFRPEPALEPASAPPLEKPPREGRLVLIIEDDARFAEVLASSAREAGFQASIATTADEGLKLALGDVPDAVLLDIHLPDHTGLSVLDRLKRTPALRHIPVHVLSVEDYAPTVLAMGAVGYLKKPTDAADLSRVFGELEARFSRETKRVLVVEDDEAQRSAVSSLLSGERVETVAVATVSDALRSLREGTFDCIVTDLSLPDASGYDLLERLATDTTYQFPPVVVYTGRSLTAAEEQRLRRYSDAIVVKGARSPERLLDEVTLFLHQVEAELPAERQRMLREVRHREAALEGRCILVVEDDVRNVFALTSVLEPKGAVVEVARNGREALEFLERAEARVDLVLMDLMMPEMDGLTAIREIRKRQGFAKLPIIALTAKAMRDDQEKSIAAGANDYTPKPVDVEVLLSLIRVWLPR